MIQTSSAPKEAASITSSRCLSAFERFKAAVSTASGSASRASLAPAFTVFGSLVQAVVQAALVLDVSRSPISDRTAGDLHGMQEVRGSTPLSSTFKGLAKFASPFFIGSYVILIVAAFEICPISCPIKEPRLSDKPQPEMKLLPGTRSLFDCSRSGFPR